jgi:hypothetical protein
VSAFSFRKLFYFSVFIIFGISACSKFTSLSSSLNSFSYTPLDKNEWEERRWLEKTVRVLRGGQGLDTSEDIESFAKMPPDQLIDHLMNDIHFADTVLDFVMFFLGQKTDSVKNELGRYQTEVYNFPQAIQAAKNVFQNKDFLAVFDYAQEPYQQPLMQPVSFESASDGLPADELRQFNIGKIKKTMSDVIEYIEQNPNESSAHICDQLVIDQIYKWFRGVGMNSSFVWQRVFHESWYGRVSDVCESQNPQTFNWLSELNTIVVKNNYFFNSFLKFAAGYDPANINEIKIFNLNAIQLPPKISYFSIPMAERLPNSSTNFNRKRAAYTLKHFFCDDLTPIGVDQPSFHAKSGGHGSDTSCYACHYKLDPMAGFFKDYGRLFFDFSKKSSLTFDDNAVTDLAEYQKSWQTPAGSARTWDIGYIRSATSQNLNDYGENIDDLFRIIKQAPEVKRCLVKRMFEYFVSEEQAVDAGYLQYLTDDFIQAAKVNSSQAFKKTVKRLLLSQSFKRPDVESDQCYDFPPGTNPSGSPPCRVAFIFQNNCASCHSSTSGFGGLDLSHWILLENGERNFPHLVNGTQADTSVTFERILDRLSTSDTSRRMPLGRYLGAQEREELYLWSSEILNK